MMMNTGYLLLIFTTLTTAVAMAGYAPGVRRGEGNPRLGLARGAVFLTLIGLVASAGYLWYLLINHQYQVDYVFRYTSNDQPFRYIISAFWGGQEGTFLLWAVYGGILAVFLRFKARQYEAPVLFFYLGINLFLMLMLLKASPFRELAGTPPDGNGLNPLLQDPWMTIHPPVMFFGFASLGIPAAYAMAALVKEDWDEWVKHAIPWTIFGILALGTGLTMGGYWAYSILGWGGFWGWDPVENSSLVPWLMAIALLHNQVIQLARGIFRRANLFLAMVPFILLTYSTFLTRSGVLADFSVHSFTDLGINQFLVAFMTVFFGGGMGLFIFKFRRIPVERAQAPLFSREYFMFLGALSFSLFGLFVLLGTSAPLLTQITGTAANVQPEFYNRMGLPFAILITTLVSMAPFLVWKRSGFRKAVTRMRIPILLMVLVVPLLIFWGDVRTPGHLLLITTAIFAVFSNIRIVVEIARKKWSAAAGYVAHVGIGLCVLGIVASTVYSVEETVVLTQGEETLALGYGFTYLGYREVESGRKNAYDVTLRTADGLYIISPTMYFSDYTRGMMKKPAIKSFWNRDVYISPIGHAVDPLSQRIQTTLLMAKGQPVSAYGMIFHLDDIGAQTHKAEDDGALEINDLVATIRVELGDRVVETVRPVLRLLSDGNTEVMPAVISENGHQLTLLGVDSGGTHVKIGIDRPPLVLSKGEDGDYDDVHLTFVDYDMQLPARTGGTVRAFAQVKAEVAGEMYEVSPGLVSRPGGEELELMEVPLGRTGLNLVLARVDPKAGEASFYVTETPAEYLYAEVSLKPFIILMWIGAVITILGLVAATVRRGRMAGRLRAAVAGERATNGKREAA